MSGYRIKLDKERKNKKINSCYTTCIFTLTERDLTASSIDTKKKPS